MVYADDILTRGNYEPGKTFADITNGTVTGAGIGLLGGVLYAYFNKKPFVQSMMIGAVLGFAISGIFLIQK